MKKLVLPALAAVFLTVGAVNAETTGKAVGWADLIDQTAQSFEDPFLDLTADQIESLRTIVFSRAKLESDDVAGEKRLELQERIRDAQAELSQSGVDADWLISQRWLVKERRENAAIAGNPAIDGQSVTLSGYAIPAPPDADGSALVYLVPERGMCSHMPPPDPNQMVKVRLNDEWRPAFVYEPVRLTGTMSIAPSRNMVNVVDGAVQMRTTFLMSVDRVETLADETARPGSPATDVWIDPKSGKSRVPGTLSARPASR